MSGVCLITGGARGIGRATAALAAQAGYAVAVGHRSHGAEAEAVVAAIADRGGRAIAVRADVAREDEVRAMFEASEKAFGPVTALVNSAGVSHHTRVADVALADIERLMAINVAGLILCCREAVRRMSTAAGGRGGAIVNVSSMAATTGGRPGASAYAASKGAVDSFTKGLAREAAAEGIRANVVRPGMTETDMTSRQLADPARRAAIAATIPMGRVARPEEMAETILWLLSDKASFVTGAMIDVGGGGFVIGPNARGER